MSYIFTFYRLFFASKSLFKSLNRTAIRFRLDVIFQSKPCELCDLCLQTKKQFWVFGKYIFPCFSRYFLSPYATRCPNKALERLKMHAPYRTRSKIRLEKFPRPLTFSFNFFFSQGVWGHILSLKTC